MSLDTIMTRGGNAVSQALVYMKIEALRNALCKVSSLPTTRVEAQENVGCFGARNLVPANAAFLVGQAYD